MRRGSNAETAIRKSVLAAVNSIPGVRFWDNQIYEGPTPTSPWVRAGLGTGSADLIGCVNGTFVAWEIKTETGSVSMPQACFRRAVESVGGRYDVIRSVSDARAALEAMGVQWTCAAAITPRTKRPMVLEEE